MNYTKMLEELMEGKKAKLPHWKGEKYIYIEREWSTTQNNKNHVPFLCIVDNEKVGPAILHNCDMFKTNWIVW